MVALPFANMVNKDTSVKNVVVVPSANMVSKYASAKNVVVVKFANIVNTEVNVLIVRDPEYVNPRTIPTIRDAGRSVIEH